MTKKLEEEMREDLPLQEAEETSPPQTKPEELSGSVGGMELSGEQPAEPQTDSENAELIPDPPEDGVPSQDNASSPQTDSENQPDAGQKGPDGVIDPEKSAVLQTDTQSELNGSAQGSDIAAPQTEPEKPKRRGRPRKAQTSESQLETGQAPEPEAKPIPQARNTSRRSSQNIISIDERPAVETDADKARNDLLDLLESMKTGRILTGTIQGDERPDNSGEARAVVYHGDFKVMIPASQAVDPPADFRGRLPDNVLHYMITKRLGAEVDYIVKGVDPQSGIAAASRLEAMAARRRQYYFGTDRDGNNLLYTDICAEARVVSVIRAGIFIDLFGVESYIPLRELSYQRLMNAAGQFQPGQRILVKILDIDRKDRNHIQVRASVKQASENPYEKALRRYTVGDRYVGTVSMVDTNGVFVALDGGIDCLCSYPKRGRPPKGARVTVRILGINNESNRIWGAITHIAVPR